jgi:hypothetical protein
MSQTVPLALLLMFVRLAHQDSASQATSAPSPVILLAAPHAPQKMYAQAATPDSFFLRVPAL